MVVEDAGTVLDMVVEVAAVLGVVEGVVDGAEVVDTGFFVVVVIAVLLVVVDTVVDGSAWPVALTRTWVED